jgi:hypothetical protein
MLPFEPELVETMRLRYADAVKDIVDIGKIVKNHIEPPSKKREHVFDFYDGLRLIISRDRDGLKTFLHFSASINNDFQSESVGNKFECPKQFIDFVIEHIQELTEDKPPHGMAEIFFSEGGVLHIMISDLAGITGNICLN